MSVILYNFVILKPDRKLIRQISEKTMQICDFSWRAVFIFGKLIHHSFITLVGFAVRFSEMCASGPGENRIFYSRGLTPEITSPCGTREQNVKIHTPPLQLGHDAECLPINLNQDTSSLNRSKAMIHMRFDSPPLEWREQVTNDQNQDKALQSTWFCLL